MVRNSNASKIGDFKRFDLQILDLGLGGGFNPIGKYARQILSFTKDI